MGPNEVEDAAAEFNSRVQIVSPPPDQNRIQNRRFAGSLNPPCQTGGHRFSRNSAAAAPFKWIVEPRLNSLTVYRTADISARARPRDREATFTEVSGRTTPKGGSLVLNRYRN
jgi:hypothetical protein